MSHLAPPPFIPLPLARDEYNAGHMNQLIRQISVMLAKLSQPEVAKAGGQIYTLDSLPVTGNNLRDGTVYRDDGFLKIVLSNQPYAPTLALEMDLGEVTVTT